MRDAIAPLEVRAIELREAYRKALEADGRCPICEQPKQCCEGHVLMGESFYRAVKEVMTEAAQANWKAGS